MKDFKVIYSWLYNPATSISSKKSNKSKYIEYLCSNTDCSMLKNKQCLMLNPSMHGSRCPYGRKNIITGYTARSKSNYQFIEKYTSMCTDSKIGKFAKSVAYIGDYVYLSVSYLGLNEELKDIVKYGTVGFFGTDYLFVEKRIFDIGFILKYIINFTPVAFLGGCINSYKKESIPMFCKHLLDIDKQLFEKLTRVYPSIKNISNIQRKAYLSTITPNIGSVVVDGKTWRWDGEKLHQIGTSVTVFILKGKYTEMSLKPISPDLEICIITDEDQVNDSTIFYE